MNRTPPTTTGSMRVLGMMSGTSADGIDAALVHISGAPPTISAKLEGHHHISFPAHVRKKVLRLANNAVTTTAEISELNFVLGGWFAEAVIQSCRDWNIQPRSLALIGSHGQTVYHQGSPGIVLGARRIASTLQIGELSVIAERTGVPTIGNFRPRDMPRAKVRRAAVRPFRRFTSSIADSAASRNACSAQHRRHRERDGRACERET